MDVAEETRDRVKLRGEFGCKLAATDKETYSWWSVNIRMRKIVHISPLSLTQRNDLTHLRRDAIHREHIQYVKRAASQERCIDFLSPGRRLVLKEYLNSPFSL